MFLIELGLIKISRVPSIVEVQYPEVVGCMVKCLRNGCCESADDGDVQKIIRMMELLNWSTTDTDSQPQSCNICLLFLHDIFAYAC